MRQRRGTGHDHAFPNAATTSGRMRQVGKLGQIVHGHVIGQPLHGVAIHAHPGQKRRDPGHPGTG